MGEPQQPEAIPAQAQAPAAPPTTQGDIPAPMPVWPIVFGVLLIVFGAGAVLQGLAAILIGTGAQWFGAAVPDDPAVDKVFGMFSQQRILGGAGMLVGVLGIVAGVGLLRRRRWGVFATSAWSWLKILLTIAASIWAVIWQGEMLETVGAGQPPPPRAQGLFVAMQVVGVVVGVAWGCALPVILIIWLRRSSVRETWRAWPAQPATPGAPV